jgi:hypothetical protein
MRTQSEFRGVGLADEYRARAAQPLDHQPVGRRNEVLQDRRSQGHANAFDRLQIFDRVREPVQGSHGFASRELRITRARLHEQICALLECDDGVNLRIDPPDMIEVRAHHFGAGHLARMYRLAEAGRVHKDDVVGQTLLPRPPRE